MTPPNFEMLAFRGQVESVKTTDPRFNVALETAMERASRAHVAKAQTSPIGPNDQPRMLHLTAWMCHAEAVNLHNKAFMLADLEEVIKAGLFTAPYFGMIDFNHDFKAYGAWYKADLKLDPSSGTYGIMVEGAIFAWAYPELANALLAMQAKNGYIDFSMACLATSYADALTADGKAFQWMRKPVFFTTSALTITPADQDAVGFGSEDPADNNGNREQRLMSLVTHEENAMPEEMEEQVEVLAPEVVTEAYVATEEVAEVIDVVVDAPADTAATVVIVEAPENCADDALNMPVDPTAPTDAAAASLANMIATLTMALKAAEDMVASLTAQNSQLAAYKESTEVALAAEVSAREDAEKALLRDARLLELPESVRTEMQTVEKASLLDSWVSQDEAQWDVTKSLFALASAGKSRSKLDASLEEGRLALGGGGASESGFAIDRYRK